MPVGPLQYQALEDWDLGTPDNFMRLEQFQIQDNSELAVYFLPGEAGSVDANIARWKKQFLANEARKVVFEKKYNYKSIPLTKIMIEGDYKEMVNPFDPSSEKKIKDSWAMFAVVAELEEGKLFFKALGPKEELLSSQEDIDEFVSTFRI